MNISIFDEVRDEEFAVRVVVEKDEPKELIGVMIDITERKCAEESLRESDQVLQAMFQSLSSHVTVLDREGVITYASRSWEEFARENNARLARVAAGVNYLDECGRASAEGDHSGQQALAGIEAVLARQLPSFTLEYPCFSPSEQSWYLMQVDPMPPEHGGVIISHTDITGRKRIEEALLESKNRYLLAATAGGVCVWDYNFETNDIYADPPIEAFLGYEEHELYGSIDDLVRRLHPEDVDRVVALAQANIRGGSTGYEVEYRLLRKDGRAHWFLTRATIIRDETGKAVRMIGTTTHINERKKAEDDLHKALAEVERLKNQLQAENIYLQEEILSRHNFGEIIGKSELLQQALHKASQVSATDVTVLILGETGTGKELFARAIHSLSRRKDRSLVKVNCATLPADLIESELFGHEKGAFTGAATTRTGRFEVADGTTIFLDEIGELPLDLQSKLLRVLQEGEFERLGSSRTIKVNVRVIAATNRDLEAAVRQGSFRADLYYRLHVFPVVIPPLREHPEDIPLLVSHFVDRASKRLGKKIETVSPKVMEAMQKYHWPGNVRELRNVIERAVITTQGARLQLADILEPRPAIAENSTSYVAEDLVTQGDGTLADVERDYIFAVLERTYWRIEGESGAAEILGINPSTLRHRMRKLGIQRPKLRG